MAGNKIPLAGAAKHTCIIVPCYNEAERLDTRAFTRFSEKNTGIDFLFVDDGSKDRTRFVLDALKASNEHRFEYILHPHNRGKAAAVLSGFRHALKSTYKLIGYWDADLSTPLSEIRRLEKYFENPSIQMVMGSRIKILGSHIQRKIYRHLAGRIFATAASMVLDMPVYDTQCGAKILRNNETLREIMQDDWLVNWTFDVELIRRYQIKHVSAEKTGNDSCLIEVPLKYWYDVAGSKVSAADFFIAMMELLRIHLHYR